MPTGTALHDPRQQLFGAAARVLLRAGVTGLTSRAVTTEAGVAKGVLHRHFADFDDFLTALVLDRIAAVRTRSEALRAQVGEATLEANLTGALTSLFDPVMTSIVALVIAHDELRHRLRAAGTSRLPLVGEGTAMIAGYLGAERDTGRLPPDADVDRLAPALIGAAHLLFTEHQGSPPPAAEIRALVTTLVHQLR